MRLKQSVLGVGISVTNPREALRFVKESINHRRRAYICVAAVHLIMECQYDRGLLNGVNRADLVVPDGMPLVWLLKAIDYTKVSRVYGPDLMLAVCRLAAERNYPVFLLGGASGQSKEVEQALLSLFPKLRIVGRCDSPVRPVPPFEKQKIIAKINQTKPEIVFIGLGCPWQEQWMIENRTKLSASVLIGVGAAFDFLSARARQAPVWVQRAGFEWLFRFSQEPKRLWRRYTITNIKFLFLLFRSWLFGGYGK